MSGRNNSYAELRNSDIEWLNTREAGNLVVAPEFGTPGAFLGTEPELSLMHAAAQPAMLEKSYTLFCLDDGQRTQQIVDQVAKSNYPVLIVGEGGTGKLNIAERIHAAGAMSARPFTAISGPEAETEKVSAALSAGGTVYFRSVGQLSSSLQSLAMSFSGSKPVRIIGSSRRPLAESVRLGTVSEDFFYSIAGVTLHTVPLRNRKADILEIANEMLAKAAIEMNRATPTLDSEFEDLLLHYSWPGNLAELDSAMKACVLIGNQEFALSAMRASMTRPRGAKGGVSLKEVSRVASMRAEQELISEVLHATGGNRKQAAKQLKISYKALLYKLKRIGGGATADSSNGEMS
jgi:DNA-binding NtrC family response regulator